MSKGGASQPHNVEKSIGVPAKAGVSMAQESEPSAGQGKIDYAQIKGETRSLVIAGDLPQLTFQGTDSSCCETVESTGKYETATARLDTTTGKSDTNTGKASDMAVNEGIAEAQKFSATMSREVANFIKTSSFSSFYIKPDESLQVAHAKIRAAQRTFYGW